MGKRLSQEQIARSERGGFLFPVRAFYAKAVARFRAVNREEKLRYETAA